MNEKIPFKKDIIFKTSIGEITDITLNHDYMIKDELVEGVFYLSGKYKMTEASVIEEEFLYNIPFSIAISDRIDKDSINLTIDSFDFKFNKDVLTVEMTLNMAFDNKPEERIETSLNMKEISDLIPEEPIIEKNEAETEIKKDEMKNENEVEIKENDFEDVNIINEENNITTSEANNIIDFSKNNIGDTYTTYKVIMMRDGETLENILTKYNITIDELKSINNLDNININEKILIPIIKNE